MSPESVPPASHRGRFVAVIVAAVVALVLAITVIVGYGFGHPTLAGAAQPSSVAAAAKGDPVVATFVAVKKKLPSKKGHSAVGLDSSAPPYLEPFSVTVSMRMCNPKYLGGCDTLDVRASVQGFVGNVNGQYEPWANAFHNMYGLGGYVNCGGYSADQADITQACSWRGANPAAQGTGQYISGFETITGSYSFGPLHGSFQHQLYCRIFPSTSVRCYLDGKESDLKYTVAPA